MNGWSERVWPALLVYLVEAAARSVPKLDEGLESNVEDIGITGGIWALK